MPYDACEKVSTTVSSLSLVRYRLNDYSVPTTYGHHDVLVRGYVHEVMISCGAEVIARHPRSYEREDFIFDPLHYLALIEQKINALDQAAPLAGWRLPEEFATLRRLLEARMGKQVNDATAHERSAISDGDDDTPAIAPVTRTLEPNGSDRCAPVSSWSRNGLPLAVLEPF